VSGERPEPGWYEDPLVQHDARWWDGRAWTLAVRDKASPATRSPRWDPTPTQPVPTAVRADQALCSPDPYERFAGWILLGMIPVLIVFLLYSSWVLAGAGR